MAKTHLIPPTGKFYKAAMHAHTNLSDGKLTPQQLKDLYRSLGYSVVAFTDHVRFLRHNDLTDAEFLAINAYEFAVAHEMVEDNARDDCYHLNFYAKTPDIDKQVMFDEREIDWWGLTAEQVAECQFADEWVRAEYSPEYINKVIKKAGEHGFLVCYNHPVWSKQKEPDFVTLEGLLAFEIYNHDAQIMEGNGFAPHMYTSMLEAGKMVGCFAADDCHCGKSNDPSSPYCDAGGGYVMIKAEELNYSAIMGALERKEYYASTGVEIKELYVEDGKVHIHTSPCTQITFITDTRRRESVRVNDNGLTEAVFSLELIEDKWPYNLDYKGFWIMCEDNSGKFAATCAVPVEGLR
ncbi:MAG: PHP domain-containing protein [Ruminococcaceae bacterium]|nr:PHP domain-containing protein [Oscillospiraceae bacterium]